MSAWRRRRWVRLSEADVIDGRLCGIDTGRGAAADLLGDSDERAGRGAMYGRRSSTKRRRRRNLVGASGSADPLEHSEWRGDPVGGGAVVKSRILGGNWRAG